MELEIVKPFNCLLKVKAIKDYNKKGKKRPDWNRNENRKVPKICLLTVTPFTLIYVVTIFADKILFGYSFDNKAFPAFSGL